MKVVFPDGETATYSDEQHLAQDLEFFDSTDPEYAQSVKDALGRPLRLEIDNLEVERLELIASSEGSPYRDSGQEEQ